MGLGSKQVSRMIEDVAINKESGQLTNEAIKV